MKKTLYILAAALIGICACNRNEFEPLQKEKAPESGKVAVTMSLTVPVELSATTKANDKNFRDNLPKIEYIKVAVFGTSGYPQAYALAEPVNKGEDAQGNPVYTPGAYASQNGVKYYFKVLLPVYEGEAHVHIIANGDETIRFDGEDENSIMSAMETTDDVGAYWASVILEDGILADLDENGIMRTDEDGNFIPSNETAALFEELVLVRNFAQVTLENAADNLYDVSWTLVNIPKTGSVAPMQDGKYVYDYKNYTYNTTNGLMVYGDKTYNGYMTNTEIDTTIPAGTQITNPEATPLFVYERVNPNNTNPTAILMKARFGSSTADYTYYRLDLMAESLGGYFPLYRNYKYQIKINRVGNKGSSTPTEAMLHESGSNVSMSAEARTLTDISDGYSRLYVEYVEKTFTTGGQKSFWVYYIPDVTTGIRDNTKLEVTVKNEGTALVPGTFKKDETRSADDDMYFYTFELNGQSETVDLESVFNIKASNGATDETQLSTLYRDITVKVIKKMDMILSLDPKKIDTGKNETTVLSISLKDELPQSMFPLEFYIEDTNRTLNPTGKDGDGNSIDVPVKLGTSLFDENNKNSYYYIRTVNYDEYQELYEAAAGGTYSFTTEFKTVKEASATTIYVDNDYFNMQNISLLNDNLMLVPSATVVGAHETSVDVKVEIADQDLSWTVEGGEGVTLDKTGAEGDGTFTMTFAENSSLTTDNTYTATVTYDGSTYPVTITQKAREFSVITTSSELNYNALTATVTIDADDDITWTATIDGDATFNEPASGNSISPKAVNGNTATFTGKKTLTVTLPSNRNASPKTYTITAVSSTTPEATATGKIVQKRAPAERDTFGYRDFNISSNAAEVNSSDGYVNVSIDNVTSNNSYIRMSTNNRAGTITVTPTGGVKITTVVITYSGTSNALPTNAGQNYTLSGTTGTWTVNSTAAKTLTFDNTGNRGRRVTSIVVNVE